MKLLPIDPRGENIQARKPFQKTREGLKVVEEQTARAWEGKDTSK